MDKNSKNMANPKSLPRRLYSDVTVAGAGLAGICAAVAAAREGLSVILINDRSVLGGNASSEIGIAINGASHLGLNPAIYAREGGLAEEIRLRMLEYNRGGGYERAALTDAVLFDLIYEEKGITLLLNTGVYECEKEGNRISLCRARHSVSNVVYEMESRFYIDATGNGILACEAGASFRMGREGRAEHGERKAPLLSDAYTMGNTFYFETRDCGHEVKYTPPAFARKVGEMDFIREIDRPGNHRALSVKGAHWSFEYGGQKDVIYDSEDIDLELRRLVFGIWDYVKNSGKYPEARNFALKRVHAKAGARESRRILGDYVLTENDIEEKRDFPDGVCIGGWPMDVHAPLGIYDPGPATEFIPVTGIYNIPFRCLYSRDVENLMMAGRNISVTHVALGSARVMATCACMGQAVGTAAKCCADLEIAPAALAQRHPEVLREKLARADQTVAGLKELSPLMENFRASASGERCFENNSVTVKRQLDRTYGLALMLATEHLNSLELWVENAGGRDMESEGGPGHGYDAELKGEPWGGAESESRFGYGVESKGEPWGGAESESRFGYDAELKGESGCDTESKSGSGHGAKSKGEPGGGVSKSGFGCDTESKSRPGHGTESKDESGCDTESKSGSGHGTKSKDESECATESKSRPGHGTESKGESGCDTESKSGSGHGAKSGKDIRQDTKLEFQILEGLHRETFLPERLVKTGEQRVAADFRGWLRLDLDGDRGRDGKLYLILKPNPDLWVGMTSAELPGAVTLRLYPEGECRECNHDSVPLNPESGYLYLDHRYNREENIAFREAVPRQNVFAPEMALTPYTRPYGMPNLWIGSGAYPRTLTLTAKRPVDADWLAVTFDTDLRLEPLTELPGCLVRDFDVTVWMGEGDFRETGNVPEAGNPQAEGIFRQEIRDNCRRQVRFLIKGKKIGKIEITIRRSWGGDAGIYGVNLW